MFRKAKGDRGPKINERANKAATEEGFSVFDALPLRGLMSMFRGKGVAKATSCSRFSLGISLRLIIY